MASTANAKITDHAGEARRGTLDYASLRKRGIEELERLSGGQWTDFNTHDPGITLLEVLCYALTDLGYRTAHSVPDLLAEGGKDPYESLHPAAKVLPCRPVTPADLRRVVLDVEGVQNAWVEPLVDDAPVLYYHPADGALGLRPEPLPSEPVKLRGLYRVLIDPADDAGADLRARVALRLHDNRGLCEDFAEITVLTEQKIQVDATVEIGPADDVGRIQREIVQRVAAVISPPIVFRSAAELLRSGLPVDAIFEGPLLEHGVLPDDALAQATRRSAVNTSDLVHAIRDVEGVRAVSSIRIRASGAPEGPWQGWSLAVAAGQVARLDREASSITLRRGGKIVARTTGEQPAPASPAVAAGGGLSLPRGRDRHVAKHTSLQKHLPAVYGIGDMGLPASAPDERRARAKQLRAYLMFFDQILANHLAQLAHLGDLFSHEDTELVTYFAQPAPSPGPEPEAIRAPRDEEELLRASLAMRRGGGARALEVERKSRFLSHLLARFAETLDHDAERAPSSLARRKQDFLRQIPHLGGARGAAFNYLEPPGSTNRPGAEQRIRLKLGLTAAERPIVVEHILLRPLEGDERQDVPLLSTAMSKDPYSMQLTFVLPHGVGRYPRSATDGDADRARFAALVEQTIREETPAHLAVYVRWVDRAAWEAFRDAHEEWLRQHRRTWAGKLGVRLPEER